MNWWSCASLAKRSPLSACKTPLSTCVHPLHGPSCAMNRSNRCLRCRPARSTAMNECSPLSSARCASSSARQPDDHVADDADYAAHHHGNAFAANRGPKVAVVDYDHGPESVRLRSLCSIAANIKTFRTIDYTTNFSTGNVRTGKIDAAIIIPAQYSACLRTDAPELGWLWITQTVYVRLPLSEMQSLVHRSHGAGDSAASG